MIAPVCYATFFAFNVGMYAHTESAFTLAVAAWIALFVIVVTIERNQS